MNNEEFSSFGKIIVQLKDMNLARGNTEMPDTVKRGYVSSDEKEFIDQIEKLRYAGEERRNGREING